jgi:ABC-type dipeptide/oligopeptide/nickel transport system permease component
VLPGLTLALFFAAIYARVIGRVFSVPGDIPTRRRSLVIARMVGRDLGYALGAAAVVEVIFGIPGVLRALVFSSEASDYPVAEAALLLACWSGITLHFVVDVLVGALDADLRREWPVASVRART